MDAFRAFDLNGDGQLSCSELFGGLAWLGLEGALDVPLIHALVRRVDSDGDGLVSMRDFRAAFHKEPARMLRRLLQAQAAHKPLAEGMTNGGGLEPIVVPQKKIQAIFLCFCIFKSVSEGMALSQHLNTLDSLYPLPLSNCTPPHPSPPRARPLALFDA